MRPLLCALCLLFLLPASLHSQSSDAELVNVKELIPDIVLDLKYSTVVNFTAQKLYTTNECLLARGMVNRLAMVQDSLRKRGLGLKIFDGYRPRAVQYLMFEIYPDPTFVADPATGSKHNRGAAVDLTLVNLATGQELVMPTGFDDFSDAAAHGWTIGMSAEQIANRELLLTMMVNVGGLTSLASEWWHYEHGPSLTNPLFDFQMK
ncbi:MAG: M15 family metallopeptidase [Ignavibacteriae bacterium]|nr:M15 family metallopeptidase [Ignavibacteriota bacterium]